MVGNFAVFRIPGNGGYEMCELEFHTISKMESYFYKAKSPIDMEFPSDAECRRKFRGNVGGKS
jgi:hypothetical protein